MTSPQPNDRQTFDLIIVGTGPGGYVAAVRAARLGMRVACVEKEARVGGVCLNVGCIPSKALLDSSEYYHLARTALADHGIGTGEVTLDLAAMMARKDRVVADLTGNVAQMLESHRVALFRGRGRLQAADRVRVTPETGAAVTLTAPRILLATGSEPVAPSGMAFDGRHIVSSTEALAFDAVPERLGIVGGGYIGLELGSVWARLGARVTVIEMLPAIAALLDDQIGRGLERLLTKQGIAFRTATRVREARVSDGAVELKLENDQGDDRLTVDRLLVAVGRRPLTRDLGLADLGVATDPRSGHVKVDGTYQTSVSGVYAIGDLIAGPALAHKASAEGVAAVEGMAGKPAEVNYDTIPAVIYTWPEAAWVGLTEAQLKERHIPYCVGTYPFAGAGRARCMGAPEGFVKLLSHGTSDRLLGVHILGARAADMIAECVLAMEFGASAEDLARTIHGHPTFAEALQEAAAAMGECGIYTP